MCRKLKSDELLQILRQDQNVNTALVSQLVDELIEEGDGAPFKEDLLGSGPWIVRQNSLESSTALCNHSIKRRKVTFCTRPFYYAISQVRYTRGAPFLWSATWNTGKVLVNSSNRASQEFGPRDGRSVLNKVEYAGADTFISASGTYEPLVRHRHACSPPAALHPAPCAC